LRAHFHFPTLPDDKNIIATNRRARFEYHILHSLETGIVLRGTEVKSIRGGKVNLQDSYATVEKGELFLHHMHIAPFEQGNIFNHDPLRVRKLLATRREIRKLAASTEAQGLTLIPLALYFRGRYLKVELAVCKGKKLYDKRESVKERTMRRESDRRVKL
jgi:SsrA-binding protein